MLRSSVTKPAKLLEVFENMFDGDLLQTLNAIRLLHAADSQFALMLSWRVRDFLAEVALRYVIFTLVIRQEHLHVLLAHETHSLENPVVTLILIFLLALNDLIDGGSVFHHFS